MIKFIFLISEILVITSSLTVTNSLFPLVVEGQTDNNNISNNKDISML